MRKLIKSIREYLGLSQTEFADKIGVTFATVNRWENGRAIPTKLAQATLYEYCKEHGVPVYQMILEKNQSRCRCSPPRWRQNAALPRFKVRYRRRDSSEES